MLDMREYKIIRERNRFAGLVEVEDLHVDLALIFHVLQHKR